MKRVDGVKFIVVNKKHLKEIRKSFPITVEHFEEALESVNKFCPNNKYYVCNQNEPYAGKVIDIILSGEDAKKSSKHLYFLDTEFIEKPNTIQLISIGIKCSDGRKYYAISSEFNVNDANDWVRENVIDNLEHDIKWKRIEQIRKEILEFVIGDNIEFWRYYADYDWVVFCWIFGKMIDLPKGFPKHCKDLKQLLDESGKKKLPDPENEHNALTDAEWNEKLYNYLIDK